MEEVRWELSDKGVVDLRSSMVSDFESDRESTVEDGCILFTLELGEDGRLGLWVLRD